MQFVDHIEAAQLSVQSDPRQRSYIIPKKIVWKTNGEKATVKNEAVLLKGGSGQITFDNTQVCTLTTYEEEAGLLLDFGIELQGGIQILTSSCGAKPNLSLRVRFGESAMEAMSEIGYKNATNDHAIRDQIHQVSFLGATEVGTTGFRFVRIDLVDQYAILKIKSIRAICTYRNVQYAGSFRCNDEQLNQIWDTAAYTIHLNMQEYLWDGIKRDRLPWVGDMHPEISAIQTLFGYNEVVPKTLDLIRNETPLPGWMNHIPSYSMWWVLIQASWYRQNGDKAYLGEQREYLVKLLSQLDEYIDEKGQDTTPEMRFVDWPSYENKEAVDAGVQALHILAVREGAKLCKVLNENEAYKVCIRQLKKLRQYHPQHNNAKQAVALMALASMESPKKLHKEVLGVGGAKGFSTFMGYYILKAMAMVGDIAGGLQCIRDYWGGMLKLGATTFWEDFNVEWLKDAASIDELVTGGKVDVHGTYGGYCYKGYRHSLCHGWAAGPLPWLSEYVLGIKIQEAGCKVVKIEPYLGELKWVEGSYPTPFGMIAVRHEKLESGELKTTIEAPEQIKIIK